MTDVRLSTLLAGSGFSVRPIHRYPGLWFVCHWAIEGVGRTPMEAVADFDKAAHEPSGKTAAGLALKEAHRG